jgi:hypothetical protein
MAGQESHSDTGEKASISREMLRFAQHDNPARTCFTYFGNTTLVPLQPAAIITGFLKSWPRLGARKWRRGWWICNITFCMKFRGTSKEHAGQRLSVDVRVRPEADDSGREQISENQMASQEIVVAVEKAQQPAQQQ